MIYLMITFLCVGAVVNGMVAVSFWLEHPTPYYSVGIDHSWWLIFTFLCFLTSMWALAAASFIKEALQ